MKKENEEMKKMRDDLNAEYDKIANEYFVVVEFTFRTVYVSKSGKVYYGPEEKDSKDINFKSTEAKITQAEVKPYVDDELAQRCHEYKYDELISIDEIKIIPMEEVKKHANVNIKDELMNVLTSAFRGFLMLSLKILTCAFMMLWGHWKGLRRFSRKKKNY